MTRFIEISEIPESGYKINEQISASALKIDDELEFPGPIVVSIDVKKVRSEALTKGVTEFSVKQTCSLCLENFISTISSSFEIEFKAAPAESIEEDHELEKEELDIVYIKGPEIDLFEVIREQIFLSLPMKPVCSPECLGLCPKCGANLNLDKCNCKVEPVGPRFKILNSKLKA
ncbi:MAG: hypothetical protein UT02_C0063G0002 [Parcubacteria group bacterium GW2011_GWC2_38_7]|nr:MAG: hypothetical protein UT02_C0063G0002 [Parcubacteria group bacterium GW2011_GWC2_38_7]